MKVKLKCGSEFNLLFGTDAEFFLEDSNDNVIPASTCIPGTKESPFKLDNGVCHPDGLSLEVGCPPADTAEGMLANLFAVIDEVKTKYLDPNGITISDKMEVKVADVLGATKKDLEFGCGSEYERGSSTMFKNGARSGEYRYSGFHIHLGYTEGQEDSYWSYCDASKLVHLLDQETIKAGLGTTDRRAKQYGGIGAFRVKPYGLEYRCMDCSVITKQAKFNRLLQMLTDLPSMMERTL